MKYLLLLLITLTLYAHQLKENYLQLDYNDVNKTLKIVLEVETRLLENENLLDDNRNSIISFKELYKHQEYLLSYTREHFKLLHKRKFLALNSPNILFHRYQDQTYMRVSQEFKNIDLNRLHLRYDMYFELEKTHKLLIHLEDERGDYILSNDNSIYHFSSFKMSMYERVSIFIKSGISHILDGLDHLLFILMLLIPTTVYLHLNAVNKNIKHALINVLKIITTFSVAHSLTLFISGIGIWTPNITFIEASIAFSIFVVAFMNLLEKYNHVSKKIVFIFGLLHGFGFANVLEIAKIETTKEFLVALFGFNLGVEFGQIFVIILLMPFLYLLTRLRWCLGILKFISFIAILISLYWFIERI